MATIPRVACGIALLLIHTSDAAAQEALTAAEAIRRFRAGDATPLWPMLRTGADRSRRTELIHALGDAGVDATPLVRRLDEETDAEARAALILALGDFRPEQLPGRQALVEKLLRWYRTDPDPGVHSAIDWLLRHGRQGSRPRVLDWQQREALERIDRALAQGRGGAGSWFVNREGHTMAVFRGPVIFEMGSPLDEVGRKAAPDSPDEPRHTVRIPRSFAIATKEVTVAQFRRFLNTNPGVKRRHAYAGDSARMARVLATFSPDDDGPQIAVTWYEAAMYCNWLSARDGIPESQWVYPTNPLEMADGMHLPPDYLRRTGYRLPTEAEWEYAARARTAEPRFFGSAESFLREYAWYAARPPQTKDSPRDPDDPQRTWPVGQLKPNDFGLFDVYGNVWEWTQSAIRLDIPANGTREDREDAVLMVSDTTARVRRGGGFPYEASAMRSASRGTLTSFPTNRRDNVGFRVARTIAP